MSVAGRDDRGADSFAREFSLEATRPSAADIASLAGILKRGTQLYLSAVPSQSFEQHVEVAATVRRAGLEPVAHLPARRFASTAELAGVLARLRGEADLRRVLVVAGDAATAGPYADTLALIQGGKLRDAGIEEIGIAGYPEGHPTITADKLEAALDQKIAAARAAGLSVHIVSQFSFDPEAIVAWLVRLRKCGIAAPVKVGMAGPTSIPALLRYAKRCGVGASLKGLMSGAASSLFGHVGPDRIVAALEAARNEIGEAHPHYFSFGGVAETARYAREKSEKAATADTVTAS
ncbi:MAG: methylenetetrahydrofolate reductase [Pseudolabrys sp.]